jgi:hypothetical protein
MQRIAALGLTVGGAAALLGAGGEPARAARVPTGAEVAPAGHEHGQAEASAPKQREPVQNEIPTQAGFRVADLTTDVEPGQLGVDIVAPSPDLAAAAATAIAGSVRIVDGRGKEIAIDTDLRVTSRREDGRVPASVVIEAGDLPEGWYTLELAEIPGDVHFYQGREPLPSSRGAAVRFRIGSAPRLRGLMVCEKADGVRALRLESSEPVLARDLGVDDVVSVQVSGGAACAPAARRAGADERLNEPRRRLDLVCDQVPDGATAQVTIRRGLRSARGAPLDPGVIRLALPSAEDLAASPEGCVDVSIE